MDPLLISLVSACTALVASVAGPLVTLAVARRQFNANVLSANRQKWIEALRYRHETGAGNPETGVAARQTRCLEYTGNKVRSS
jgi:hypothetical protein